MNCAILSGLSLECDVVMKVLVVLFFEVEMDSKNSNSIAHMKVMYNYGSGDMEVEINYPIILLF